MGFEKYSGISRPRHLSVHTRPPEFFGIADAKFLVNMQIKSYLYRGRGDLGSHSNKLEVRLLNEIGTSRPDSMRNRLTILHNYKIILLLYVYLGINTHTLYCTEIRDALHV